MSVRIGIANIDGENYFVRIDGDKIGPITKLSNVNLDPEDNRKWVEEHFKDVTITHGVKQNK